MAVLGGAVATALALPTLRYLFSSTGTAQNERWVSVSNIDEISLNRPVRVEFTRKMIDGWADSKESTSAWIVKPREGEILAFAPQCTHLGCPYLWDEKKKNFNCPCHGSRFAQDGSVLQGPARRSLDRYPTRVDGQRIFIRPVSLNSDAP